MNAKKVWLGGVLACVVASAQAIQTAGDLLVNIDAADLSALPNQASVGYWPNTGMLGNYFTNVISGKGPIYQTNVGGVPAVTFQAYDANSIMTNVVAVPAAICGSDTWSIETWVYNPSLSGTEVLFTWTARNGWASRSVWAFSPTGTCVEVRYGADTGNAVEHYALNVPWASSPLTAVVPVTSQWHHVACTRDTEGRERLYVDGQLKTITTPIYMNVRTDGVFTLGSVRDYAYTNNTVGQGWYNPFSGSLAKVRVHDGTLSEAAVVANYLEERAAFANAEVCDSIWSGDPASALPWESAANWAGGFVPGATSRVVIANGGTAVVSTAVGPVNRFLPQHGGLVLSNNAVLVALPSEASNVYMGNTSNNFFNLTIKDGYLAIPDSTNSHNLYFGVNRGQAYGVIGGGSGRSVLDVGRDCQIGAGDGSIARLTVEAGGEVCSSNGWTYVGCSGIADAKLTVNGGYVGHRRPGLDLVVAHNNAYSVLEINGGLVAPSTDLQFTRDGTARCYGAVQLNGGLLWARRLYGQNTTGTNILFLNGGTIRNQDTRNDFIFNLDWAYVQPGGAKFEIQPNTQVMTAQPLLTDPNLGDGGLTKSGLGSLVLSGANTFTGNIAVTAGHLCLSNAAGLVSGYAGSILASGSGSIGYPVAGGVATLMSRMDTSSTGGITVYPVNAAESVDLSSYPNLSLSFAGSFTYTGTYTPYNYAYKFAPVTPGNVYSAAITDGGGTASVTCNGLPWGSLELTGDNSYTGGTTINGGMLSMGHANALGTSGTILIRNGASLKLNAAGITSAIVSRIDASSDGCIILGPSCSTLNLDLTGLPGVRVGTDQGTLTFGGTVTPDNNVYHFGGGNLSHASGYYGLIVTNLTDNGATPRKLVIDAPGMVCPSNATYSGGTVVTNGGILQLRWDQSLGAVPGSYQPENLVVDGGALRPSQTTFTLNANRGITVGPGGMILHPWGGQTLTVNGSLHGSGAITNTDSGTVTLAGTLNSFTGSLTMTTGRINIGNGSSFSWNPGAKINGTGGTVGVNHNSDLTWSTSLGAALGAGGLESIAFVKTGTGTLTVDVPQIYRNSATIDMGVLKAGATGAVPAGASRGNVTINNQNYYPIGSLDVNGYNLGVNGLYGAGAVTDSTANASSFTVGDNNAFSNYKGPVATNLALTKVGSGALFLTKGAVAGDVRLVGGVGTNWPGVEAAGTVTLSANTTLFLSGDTNMTYGLLGEYFNFDNNATRQYATTTTLVSLATFNTVLSRFTPATVAISTVSNVFSFGADGVLFQNKGNYRVGRWTGKFLASTSGEYRFDSASDDGSMVFIDDAMVVSNNFSQGYGRNVNRMLAPITLEAGWHDIVVAYYNGSGGYGLTVFMTPPGGVEAPLPQSLLRPPAVKAGGLAGAATATALFHTSSSALTLSPASEAVYDGVFRATNANNLVEKIGAGKQTLRRVEFAGGADIKQGTLALKGSPMMGGAVQAVSAGAALRGGATLMVESYGADWPNAGLAGAYFNMPNFGSWFNTLSTITNTYYMRLPNLHAGSHLAGAYFDFDPNTFFPAPYNSGSFNDFQVLYQGRLVVRETGSYGFYQSSDDRSDLYIDMIQVITNATYNAARSGVAYLTAGTHDVLIPFQNGGGGYRLYVNWTPPGGTSVALPNDALRPCVAQVGPLMGSVGSSVTLADKGSFLSVNQTAETAFAGALSGPNGSEVEKAGAQRLTLTGNNDAFLGSWFISQGELWAGDGATSGTLGGSNVYVSGGAALVFNRSDNIVYAGDLAGNGEIRSAGAGEVRLTGSVSNFWGAINVANGKKITLARTLTTTNTLVSNGGTFGLSGSQTFLAASRITGAGLTRLSEGGTLDLGSPAAAASFANTLAVSNGVLALAVTNATDAWHIGSLTLDAGTALEVVPSGLWGKYYDIAYDATTISNAFRTYESATNYFASLTPALVASTWERSATLEFGSTGAFFPGKYATNGTRTVNFAAQYVGKIRVTVPGTYTFGVASDDNGIIYIDGQVVANGNYNKGIVLKTGTVALSEGLHDFALFYAQGTGGYGLYTEITIPGQAVQRIPNSMFVAQSADTPAFSLTVDALAVTNGPGAGTVIMPGQGVLKMADLWIDTGAKLAVTGSVACATTQLSVTVPQEIPYGITVVGDFRATGGLDLSGVTLTSSRPEAQLRYKDKLLYFARSNGAMMLLK